MERFILLGTLGSRSSYKEDDFLPREIGIENKQKEFIALMRTQIAQPRRQSVQRHESVATAAQHTHARFFSRYLEQCLLDFGL